MPKYTALTIGPIYSSLQKARNTRGVWGSSYLFSHLMKSIIRALHYESKEFVIPLVSEANIFKHHDGAGLFPDRFIYRSTSGGIGELTEAIGSVVEAFTADAGNLEAVKWGIDEENKAKPTNQKIESAMVTAANFQEFLLDYLVLYAVELDVGQNENVIERCNAALSKLELQQPLMSPYELDYLHYFLLGVKESAMYKVAVKRFPSLIEIATKELSKLPGTNYPAISDSADEEDEDHFIKKLKEEYRDKFSRRHKYIAIVNADGDRLGKTVVQIYKKSPEAVKEVDEILLKFNIAAVEIIRKHGGRAVYVGGDDLLFFAPVGYDGTTVFHLIETLSKTYFDAFEDFFGKKKKGNPDFWNNQGVEVLQPTLSFGLSISYYKYPLFEALEDADKLLKTAKSAAEERKNALTFCIRKHSGQTFGTTLFKDSNTYTSEFLALVSAPTVGDDSFLSSVHQHLLQFETSLMALLSASDVDKDADPLDGYFDNHFNEAIHDRHRKFLNTVKNMIWAAYRERRVAREALGQVFATLRFLQFYNQPDSDD